MLQFNYMKAWDEFASPAYENLPQCIKALLLRVINETPEDRFQDGNLDATWPNANLRKEFSEIHSDVLAQAAYIIYCYGHWAYNKYGQWSQVSGGHWRFSNYADQILRERYGIKRECSDTRSLRIIEGCLRYCYSTQDCWTWEVLGYVTRDLVDRARCYLIESEEAHVDLFLKAEKSYQHPKWNVLPEGSFMEEENKK
jgi:hypothetical protein